MKLRIILIIILIAFFQSCGIAQRNNKLNSQKDYRGSVIKKNTIKAPKYKISTPDYGRTSFNQVNLKQNEFKRDLNNQIIQIINDTIKNNPGNTAKLNLIKITNAQPNLKDFQIEEYYEIDFNGNNITVGAIDAKGIINGLASLEFELTQNKTPKKNIKDWPNIEKRIMQINLKAMDPEVVKHVLLRLWRGHFNGAFYSIHNSVEFEASKKYCLKDAMSKADFKSICDFGNIFNIEPVLDFAFLSHQNKSFVLEEISPELLFNNQTLDPRNPAVYQLIYSLIDEVIELVDPKIINIGHDEVIGFREKHIVKHGPILPSELFLSNVKKINNYLINKNISVWMWGDMLIAPEDFPNMHPGYFHATKEYRWLIDSIPKNITICDWHYKHYKGKLKQKLDFSSVDFFINKGFQVIGATYNVNEMTRQFSNYIIEKNHPRFNGMIATSWHKLLDGTIKNKEKSDHLKQYDAILEFSANAFWNAE
ncbi:MAG: family 20 glycosylhydrolase [Bacteroidetes bacterium]|nr:family 20 glycosylhydrolase [Bacteroidota bacterium]